MAELRLREDLVSGDESRNKSGDEWERWTTGKAAIVIAGPFISWPDHEGPAAWGYKPLAGRKNNQSKGAGNTTTAIATATVPATTATRAMAAIKRTRWIRSTDRQVLQCSSCFNVGGYARSCAERRELSTS